MSGYSEEQSLLALDGDRTHAQIGCVAIVQANRANAINRSTRTSTYEL